MPAKKPGQYRSPVRGHHYLRVYELSKMGLSKVDIAAGLKVSKASFYHWLKTDPDILAAYKKGKHEKETGNFIDYAYKNLPKDLKVVWDQMEAAFNEPDGGVLLKTLMDKHTRLSTKQRQHLFVHALVMSNFNAAEACRKTDTHYRTWQEWQKDAKFLELVKQIHMMKKDFVEASLMGLVDQGDSAAVIFANRTLNSDRGYNPKSVVEHTHGGMVGHVGVTVEQVLAMLPLKMQREALKAIRSGKPAMLPAHQEVEVDPPEQIEDADYVELSKEDE